MPYTATKGKSNPDGCAACFFIWRGVSRGQCVLSSGWPQEDRVCASTLPSVCVRMNIYTSIGVRHRCVSTWTALTSSRSLLLTGLQLLSGCQTTRCSRAGGPRYPSLSLPASMPRDIRSCIAISCGTRLNPACQVWILSVPPGSNSWTGSPRIIQTLNTI